MNQHKYIYYIYVMNLELYIQNGLYIPFIFGIIYFMSNNFFLSTIICLKLYPINYFYWFNDYYHYKNIPRKFNWIKQFIRFTDSGHLASFIYYFYPSFLPISFNIHFLITFGYWVGKVCFGMKDADCIEDKIIIKSVDNFVSILNHSFPLIMIIYEINQDSTYAVFDYQNLFYSYVWGYSWIMFVYIPWIYITDDYVYNVLYPNVPLTNKVCFIVILHIISFLSNIVGYYLTIVIS